MTPIETMLADLKLHYEQSKPFCTVSIGDGECIFYSHPEIEHVASVNRYLKPNGVAGQMTDLKQASLDLLPTADYIFANCAEATDIGPLWVKFSFNWQRVLDRYSIRTPIIHVMDRYRMFTDGSLFSSLIGARILLIGHYAPAVAAYWESANFKRFYERMNVARVSICGSVGCTRRSAGAETARILADSLASTFDIALVGMGIAANYICLKLKQAGRIALNVGSVLSGFAGQSPRPLRPHFEYFHSGVL